MTSSQDGYDDAVTAIRGHLDDLGTALATWETRSEPGPTRTPAGRELSQDLADGILAGLTRCGRSREPDPRIG